MKISAPVTGGTDRTGNAFRRFQTKCQVLINDGDTEIEEKIAITVGLDGILRGELPFLCMVHRGKLFPNLCDRCGGPLHCIVPFMLQLHWIGLTGVQRPAC